MSESALEQRHSILLTFQAALLGMVTPSLRGVTVGWDDKSIRALCIFDSEVGGEEEELCSDIEGEVIASFPDYKVEVTAERLSAPAPLNPKALLTWVYSRKE